MPLFTVTMKAGGGGRFAPPVQLSSTASLSRPDGTPKRS